MKERILTFFLQADNLCVFSFQCGYLTGVLVSVLVLLLLVLLTVLLRMPSKASGVTLMSENGSLFIAGNAIKDLVKTVGEEDFPCFQILRVGLYRKKKELFLKLDINGASQDDMEEDGEKNREKTSPPISLMDESMAFQEAILKNLLTRFGIDTIKKVHIHLKRGSFQ